MTTEAEVIGSPEPTSGPGRPRKEAAPVGKPTDLNAPKEGARKRKRIGENDRQILPDTSGLDPNYNYRVVLDVKNNVPNLLDRGYEFVHSNHSLADEEAGKAADLSSQVTIVANPSSGDRGVLMRIRKDFFAEDQADKQRIVDKTEERIYQDLKSQKGLYSPDGSKEIGPQIQR